MPFIATGLGCRCDSALEVFCFRESGTAAQRHRLMATVFLHRRLSNGQRTRMQAGLLPGLRAASMKLAAFGQESTRAALLL